MAYTAQTLISRAWYLSGIVARNLQGVTGDQITDGLSLLNALLDFKSIDLSLIPYWTYKTDVVCIPGQEKYYLSNVIAVENVTFNFGSVRYAVQSVSRGTYFGTSRANNVTSLPFNWTFNRELGGGDLYLYFTPDQAYQLNIMCKMALTDVALQTDLTTVYDGSYIEYLRYALAQYMCSEYGILFNPEAGQILRKMQHQLMDVEPPDLIVHKSSILTQGSPLNFAQVNLGRGWTPN